MGRGRTSATITRAPHDSQNPYKSVRRATFEGSGLSFEARGVMAYLLMKPDNWRIDIADLMREGEIGRDKTYKIINELITHRYLERVDDRDKGKFGGATYLLYESPYPEKPEMVEPLPEKPYPVLPDTEKPLPVKPTQTNKEDSTKYEKSTKEGIVERTPGQEVYAALCEALGWDYRTILEKDRIDVAQTARTLMDAEYTVEDIRRFMVEIWFRDWRWEKHGQRPTLAQLRQEIGKLRASVPEQAPRASPASSATNAASNRAAVANVFAKLRAQQGGSPHG